MKIKLSENLINALFLFIQQAVTDTYVATFDVLIDAVYEEGYNKGLHEQWEEEESAKAKHSGNRPS